MTLKKERKKQRTGSSEFVRRKTDDCVVCFGFRRLENWIVKKMNVPNAL